MSAAAAASGRRARSRKKADHAAADSLGERDQVCGGDWPDALGPRKLFRILENAVGLAAYTAKPEVTE